MERASWSVEWFDPFLFFIFGLTSDLLGRFWFEDKMSTPRLKFLSAVERGRGAQDGGVWSTSTKGTSALTR